MKNTFLACLVFLTAISISAQVPQKVVVEHFTNTRCSNCASRNIGLFTNLANNPNVIQISYHPSSPFSNCFLHQYNTLQNNARTVYYTILGGTPRIVINGEVQAGNVNFGGSTLFDAHNNKTSPVEFIVFQTINSTQDSLEIEVRIKTIAANTLSDLSVFIPLVEDSVLYNAPNGERVHHNVFRRNVISQAVVLPALGDSLVLTEKVLIDKANWRLGQIKTLAMLEQNSDKKIIQASESAKVAVKEPTMSNGLAQIHQLALSYPNPFSTNLQITAFSGVVTLLSLTGAGILTAQVITAASINTASLAKGVYFLKLENSEGVSFRKVLKE